MKNVNLITIYFIIIFLGCKPKEPKVIIETKEYSKVEIPAKNEVVIILKDTVESLPMNVISDEYQLKQDFIVIGNKNKEIIIPTDNIVELNIIRTHAFQANGRFIKGDSVLIQLKNYYRYNDTIIYPYFTVKNRDINEYETNFDYYVNIKTPTTKTFRRYKLYAKKHENISPFTSSDVALNTKQTADSLFSKKLISRAFYDEKIAETDVFESTSAIFFANELKRKIDVDSILQYANDTFNKDYEFYSRHLVVVLRNKYFLNSNKKIKISELFSTVLKNEKILNTKLKSKVLDNLLTIVINSERGNFDKLYGEFKTYLGDDNSELIKKYEQLILTEKKDKGNMLKLKNDAGKLYSSRYENTQSLEEALLQEKGKVVLLDFWASWCAPCRMDLPSIRLIQKKIDTSKFIVISISIDKNFSAWEKASKQEDLVLKKHNYLLLDAEESDITKNYKVKTIPRYLVFNKKGILVENNFYRPSDTEFEAALNIYFQE